MSHPAYLEAPASTGRPFRMAKLSLFPPGFGASDKALYPVYIEISKAVFNC